MLKLEKWCEASLNCPEPLTEIMLCDQSVETVNTFKCLGTMIDCKLNFWDNVDCCSENCCSVLLCKTLWASYTLQFNFFFFFLCAII